LGILVEDGQRTGEPVEGLPQISRSSLNTHAVMEQGESLLIGGLIRETKVKVTKKIPIVGDVPVLGKLFSSNRNRVARTERLILITPKIIGNTPSTATGDRILKGTAKDIVKNSDQRLAEGSDEIELLSKRQTQAVNGEPPLKKPLDAFKQTVLSPHNQPDRVVKTQLSDLTVIPELKTQGHATEPHNKQEAVGNQNIDGDQGKYQPGQTVAVAARPTSNTVWSVGRIDETDTSSKWKPAIR